LVKALLVRAEQEQAAVAAVALVELPAKTVHLVVVLGQMVAHMAVAAVLVIMVTVHPEVKLVQ
jgi:hypothetical protein